MRFGDLARCGGDRVSPTLVRARIPFTLFATLLYTIPTLAFILFFVPITGLGLTTVELGLTGYTFLLMFRNALTGLQSVPPEAIRAATAMGMTPRQVLFRVTLPLATPSIMAGVRISAVTVVSLATIAADVTPLGLGAPIFFALHTTFKTELIAAGVLAILLALAADLLLVIVQRAITPWLRPRAGGGLTDMHTVVSTGLGHDIGSYFSHHAGTLFSQAITQIGLSVLSVVIAIVIGLPIGAVVGHFHRFSFIAINGGNALRALPTLAIIAIGISIYGFGLVNITVAMVILALPLILTNAYVAVDGVDPATVRAARGMGMTGLQVLLRVELPNCVPLIMTGVRTAWVYVVATAYLAAFAGYPNTLGDVITDVGSFGLGGVLAAAVVAVVIAFLGEAVLAGVQRLLTPHGLRNTATTG